MSRRSFFLITFGVLGSTALTALTVLGQAPAVEWERTISGGISGGRQREFFDVLEELGGGFVVCGRFG